MKDKKSISAQIHITNIEVQPTKIRKGITPNSDY